MIMATTVPMIPMTVEMVTCCVLVNRALDHDDDSPAETSIKVCVKDYPDAAIETRLKWAREIAKEFLSCSNGDSIRPWMFICNLDGTVERLAMQPPQGSHDK